MDIEGDTIRQGEAARAFGNAPRKDPEAVGVLPHEGGKTLEPASGRSEAAAPPGNDGRCPPGQNRPRTLDKAPGASGGTIPSRRPLERPTRNRLVSARLRAGGQRGRPDAPRSRGGLALSSEARVASRHGSRGVCLVYEVPAHREGLCSSREALVIACSPACPISGVLRRRQDARSGGSCGRSGIHRGGGGDRECVICISIGYQMESTNTCVLRNR